ncbi:MarR family transcriptional regulator [Nonomuraea ferruginea]
MGSPLRRDLHWLAARLKIGLHGIEERIAARHGMSLWGYTVLVEVVSGPARTQLALAAAVPVDKTKLVAILDELESSGLVRRRPDPRDRRARLVDPTDAEPRGLRGRLRRDQGGRGRPALRPRTRRARAVRRRAPAHRADPAGGRVRPRAGRAGLSLTHPGPAAG